MRSSSGNGSSLWPILFLSFPAVSSVCLASIAASSSMEAWAAGEELSKFNLEQCFRSSLDPDQRSSLGDAPGLEAVAKALRPEQREQVRLMLKAEEASNQDPNVLKEVFRGYSLLDQNVDALTVAENLVELEPRNPRSYDLKGAALQWMGDYEGAAEQARKALELNPEDQAALAILRLAEGRRSVKPGQGTAGGSLSQALSAAMDETWERDESGRPYKSELRGGKAAAPPAWRAGTTPKGSSRFPWAPLCAAGAVCGWGIGTLLWRGEEDKRGATLSKVLFAGGFGVFVPTAANLAVTYFQGPKTVTDAAASPGVGRKAAKRDCPPGTVRRARLKVGTSGGSEHLSGVPGQGSATNPEEAKEVERCRQSILSAAEAECKGRENCLGMKARELGYDDCQLQPSFQPGGPGMLNPKTPGPAMQVGGGGDVECVPIDENPVEQVGGTAYFSENKGKAGGKDGETFGETPRKKPGPGNEGQSGLGDVVRSVNDLLQGAKLEKEGKSIIYGKSGDFVQANREFDGLTKGADVKKHGGGVRSAVLPDGSTVSVRPSSSVGPDGIGGHPTIQINPSDGGKKIKVRYVQ